MSAAIVQRWEGFLSKVRERVQAVLAEADPGFDEIIAAEAVDPAPFSAAQSAFKARMLGLCTKIDESWSKIEGELESAGADGKTIDRCREQGNELRFEIEKQENVMRVKKGGVHARALLTKARAEMEAVRTGTSCRQCGAPVTPVDLTIATNVNCQSCNAVTSLIPGIATGMFYAGVGAHALGEEAALDLWLKLSDVEHAVSKQRGGGPLGNKPWEAAALAYWTAYFKVYGQYRRGWTAEQEQKELAAHLSPFNNPSYGMGKW